MFRCMAMTVLSGGLVFGAVGQMIEAPFDTVYSFTDLGSVPGLPPRQGGLCALAGDHDTLLIGGYANTASGTLYAVRVMRDEDGHINGFAGEATPFCIAAYNDGGVTYGPGGVLFLSRWPANQLGQVRPGSSVTDKVIDLWPWGVESSNASINFVPPGFPGAGRAKIASWSGGQWGELTLVPDGTGLYDVAGFNEVAGARLGGGPEGFTYVPPGSPLFSSPTMILSEYSNGMVTVFDLDDNGDPINATRRVFMSGLGGAEGAYIDRPTGDFLFSTFGGGERIVVVKGFSVPPPECAACAADYNQDGGIDGADVDAFFAAWEAGGC